MRLAVLLIVCGALLATDAPPKIDPALQFRVRTLEAEFQRLRAEIAEAQIRQTKVMAEIERGQQEMAKQCGAPATVSQATGEWFCQPSQTGTKEEH